MAQRYRVAALFAHEEKTFTNDDEAAIRKLPRSVRDHHIGRGNLVEWDEAEPAKPAKTTTKTKEA